MTTTAALPRIGHYDIDASASTIRFATTHIFGLAPVRGSFALRHGTVDIAEPASASAVRVEIDPASFRTHSGVRDKVVQSTKFLHVLKYPTITFSADSNDGRTLAGTLTVRDIARPVSLDVTLSTVEHDSFTVQATTRIDRTEFGVTASRGMAGRYLKLTLDITCQRH